MLRMNKNTTNEERLKRIEKVLNDVNIFYRYFYQ